MRAMFVIVVSMLIVGSAAGYQVLAPEPAMPATVGSRAGLSTVAVCSNITNNTAAQAVPETRLTIVDSSPSSWVARGYDNYTVTPANGWTFTPSRYSGNAVGFDIRGPALPGTAVDYWFLTFAAPFGALIVPGQYPNFQRWPFQDANRPGLEFGSTGRLDNQASGSFQVLQATYGPGGQVLSFSANFTHYGETIPANYAIVELRYNVPEPATLSLLALGRLAMMRRRR